MTAKLLLASALSLLLLPPQTLPTTTGPIRNTFAVAVETVIDNATAVDIAADETHFNAQYQQLKTSNDNLASLAYDDREKDIASEAKNLVFLVSACHLQAKDGASTDKCQAQLTRAGNRIMEAIAKHKSSGAWTDGPPAGA
jgi:hypothetical protein